MISTASSISRSRRASILAALSLGLFAVCAVTSCDPQSSGPRALILVDASDAARPSQAAWIRARSADFEKAHGRAVRVLRIDAVADAIELASRGEADVALIPSDADAGDSLSRFFASDHGRELGAVAIGESRLRVLVINPKQHPKVDAQGETLAELLLGSSASSASSAPSANATPSVAPSAAPR